VSTARVVAVIPAHNEEASIGDTIRSLERQSSPPSQVFVVCDNCADDTAGVAAASGAKVLTTAGNTARKAGALNQALTTILPSLSDSDLILVMDADSRISRDWIEYASELLGGRSDAGSVCGVFFGEHGGGFIGQLQRNEYFRYSREVYRHRQAPVLSGTGTLFRVSALLMISSERGGSLPGDHGDFYDSHALTEDNEITLALKMLGFRCLAGVGCETVTEIMPGWRPLWKQRLRWQKGTLSDLRRYGINQVTLPYWSKQIRLYGMFLMSIACWSIMGAGIVQHPGFNLVWSAAILAASFLDRLWNVRKAGPAGMILSVLTLPELLYDVFRMAVFFRALADAMTGRDVDWGHLNRSVRS
jgi:cellulose synthase/poly-beta-1,6-N-acetylglucosamine synthase-like glycosyltransferase